MQEAQLDLIGSPVQQKKPTRAPIMFTIPAGTPAVRCKSFPKCQAFVFWIVNRVPAREGRKEKISRVPIRADGDFGTEPTDTTPGQGQNHFIDCIDRDHWRKK